MARFSAILAALCVSLGCSTSADDRPLQPLRIGTGSSNGGFYQVGNALAQLFNERVAGVSASPVSTGQSAGSVFNIHALEQRSVDLAFARVDLAYQAYTHGTQLSARPHRRLRSIAVMYVSVLHVIVPAGSTIYRAADLRGRGSATARRRVKSPIPW